MKLLLESIFLLIYSTTLFAKQVTEFTKDNSPIVISSAKTVGKVGQKLTQDITKILNTIGKNNPEVSDSFGQLEAMYYISFDSQNDAKPCVLYNASESTPVSFTPNIQLINTTEIDSSKIRAISVLNNGQKLYFLRSKNKLIRIRISNKGEANISYYSIVNIKSESIKHLLTSTDKFDATTDSYLKTRENFKGIYKSPVKGNEVQIIGNKGKAGVYTDKEIEDSNIQLRVGGLNDKTKNYITHTHTKYISSDFRTQVGLELTKKTGIKITTGSRTGKTKKLYSSDYNLEKQPLLSKTRLEEIELARSNQEADQYFSAEVFHELSDQNRISILFEEVTKENHNKGQILGAKYSHDFFSKNLEVISIVQGQIKEFDKGTHPLNQKEGVSGWVQVKYSW